MPTRKTKVNPTPCPECAGTAWTRRVTTYPVRLKAPAAVAGKEVHVHRVALRECQACGFLLPTRAGQAKVERLVAGAIELFLGHLP